MAYRKTETILAEGQARREAIVSAVIYVIAKHGFAELSVDLIASRIKGSVGVLYKHFADKDEMVAAATAHVLAADLNAMRNATKLHQGTDALVRAVAVFFARLERPRLVTAMMDRPSYRVGITRELGRLIASATGVETDKISLEADAMLGALYGLHRASRGGGVAVDAAVNYALRIAGISQVTAKRAIDRALVS